MEWIKTPFKSVPQLQWADAAAGLCVASLLIPQAVAYAGLAHLGTSHGLIAAMVGLALYALFGGSRFAVVSPTSSGAIFTAAAALSIPEAQANPAAFASICMALVFASGIVLFTLAVTRQGQLSAYVSRPVFRGFAFALAITIVVKQIPDAVGLVLPTNVSMEPANVLIYTFLHIVDWHYLTLLIALSAGLVVALLKRWPRIPALLVIIVLAIAFSYGLNFAQMGVREIGTPAALEWQWIWPDISGHNWLPVIELSLGLVVLIFTESWGSARSLALAHGEQLSANRELMVLGACNAGSALLQGMAVGAGFSASTANEAAGAQSRWSGAVALVMIGIILLIARPVLHLLPQSVLAVVVIAALWHTLSPAPLIRVWRMNRDRFTMTATVLAVLCFGILHGMMIAIVLSIADALRRFSQPIVHELGRQLEHSHNFVSVERQSTAIVLPHVLILRPDEPLFFANAERMMTDILMRVSKRKSLRCVILSLEESSDLDSAAIECLRELNLALTRQSQHLLLSRVKDRIRDVLVLCDPQGLGSTNRLFYSVNDAATQAVGLRPLEHESA